MLGGVIQSAIDFPVRGGSFARSGTSFQVGESVIEMTHEGWEYAGGVGFRGLGKGVL